jgi:heme exporter protein C
MRERIKYVLAVLSLALFSWVLYLIGFKLPIHANVAAYQIIYFHVPSFFACFTGFFLGLVASGMYLATGNFKYDSFAAGVNEVALVFASAGLAMGMIWARYAWGIWWTWDARLTSMLMCWLLYVGYLVMRRSVEEPSTRARLSAVLSIIGCVDVGFVYKSIDWYRTQHPSAVLSMRGGGGMGPGMEYPLLIGWSAMVCLGVVLAMVRMEQGEISREIDSLRRQAHSY